MLCCKQQLAYSLLSFIDEKPNSCLMQLWTFIPHTYVFIHIITILRKKRLLCVIQFLFLYMHFLLHYSILSATVMQRNSQSARRMHVPRPCNFVSKMFLIPKFKNCLYTHPPKSMYMLIMEQPEKMLSDLRNNKGIWISVSGDNHVLNLVFPLCITITITFITSSQLHM
jgi:hypothetical protein